MPKSIFTSLWQNESRQNLNSIIIVYFSVTVKKKSQLLIFNQVQTVFIFLLHKINKYKNMTFNSVMFF